MKHSTTPKQNEFDFPQRGGARLGAGRKRVATRPNVPHRTRSRNKARHPVHVTLRVIEGVRSLRSPLAHKILLEALKEGCDHSGFRLVEYSVQTNHMHLICEAEDREVLSRGIQGMCVRMVKRLNRLWGRKGSLFADRYHDHVLRTPREVRNALAYVLCNAAHQGIHHPGGIDPCSSARWFHGVAKALSPLARARTWLLTIGWKRAGPILAG